MKYMLQHIFTIFVAVLSPITFAMQRIPTKSESFPKYELHIHNKSNEPVDVKCGTSWQDFRPLAHDLITVYPSGTLTCQFESSRLPFLIHLMSNDSKPLALYDHVTKRISKFLNLQNLNELEGWISTIASKTRPAQLSMYLIKKPTNEYCDAYSFAKFKKLLEKKQDNRSKYVPNIYTLLAPEPDSLPRTIVDAASTIKALQRLNHHPYEQTSPTFYNYSIINVLLRKTKDAHDLKKLVLLQLNMALYIVDRISFARMFFEDTLIEQYPCLVLSNPYDCKIHWLATLLQSKQDLEKLLERESNYLCSHFVFIIHHIQDFLMDIGPPPSSRSLNSCKRVRKAVIHNFKLLFEHLWAVQPLSGTTIPAQITALLPK